MINLNTTNISLSSSHPFNENNRKQYTFEKLLVIKKNKKVEKICLNCVCLIKSYSKMNIIKLRESWRETHNKQH